jgi:hypothetical protein
MSFKSYDIAERLQNSFLSYNLFASMNPDASAVIIPEDVEGGNFYSYYNIPYSIVPNDNIFISESGLCNSGVLISGICCPEGSTGLFPSGDARQGRCCEDCSEESLEQGIPGFFPINGEDYCVSSLVDPPTSGTNINFGSQPLAPPVRFSNGVWR